MDLGLSAEHEEFRDSITDFLLSNKDKWPSSGLPMRDARRLVWQQLLIEKGCAARTIPVRYGGYGADPDILKSRLISEAFAQTGAPPPFANQGVSMLVPTLLEKGSEEQKLAWVGRTLRGETIWCQGYSEPGAGSDLASLKTSAVLDGEDYVINGQKIWTSTAKQADMIFCLVRTDTEAPKHHGISYMIFSMDTPGVEVRPLVDMAGSPNCNEVFFTDVRVPKNQIVGEPGQGWAVANATLKHERGMLGNPNAAKTRLLAIVELMKTETIDGKRMIDNPIFRDRLVKLQAEVYAMQANGMRVTTASLNGEGADMAGLVIKLQGCELNFQLAGLAIDVMGELGLLYGNTPRIRDKGSWQWRFMYDLGWIIGGGTAQIQKNIISERGLGMPREPKPAMA